MYMLLIFNYLYSIVYTIYTIHTLKMILNYWKNKCQKNINVYVF